jgi:hypothetical protein
MVSVSGKRIFAGGDKGVRKEGKDYVRFCRDEAHAWIPAKS